MNHVQPEPKTVTASTTATATDAGRQDPREEVQSAARASDRSPIKKRKCQRCTSGMPTAASSANKGDQGDQKQRYQERRSHAKEINIKDIKSTDMKNKEIKYNDCAEVTSPAMATEQMQP